MHDSGVVVKVTCNKAPTHALHSVHVMRTTLMQSSAKHSTLPSGLPHMRWKAIRTSNSLFVYINVLPLLCSTEWAILWIAWNYTCGSGVEVIRSLAFTGHTLNFRALTARSFRYGDLVQKLFPSAQGLYPTSIKSHQHFCFVGCFGSITILN